MQKKTNAKTIVAVHTPYLYKISVQARESRLENNKVIKTIKIDKTKTYGRVIGF